MNGRHTLMVAFAGISFCACAHAANVLVNPGFETGSLNPWFADFGAPTVTNADAHTGSFSVAALGGDSIRQNFASVATNSVTEVSFWAKRPPFQFDQYSLYYSDAPTTTDVIQGSTSDWAQFNVTSHLTPGAHLTGFSIFGTSPGPAFLDDFVINAIPEPSGVVLSVVAFVGTALRPQRRKIA